MKTVDPSHNKQLSNLNVFQAKLPCSATPSQREQQDSMQDQAGADTTGTPGTSDTTNVVGTSRREIIKSVATYF